MNTYVLLNEYIPEIKFKGKLLNSDVVTVGETVTFDASDSNFCSDYAGIVHGFLNFPKNHAENISGYPKYFFDKRDNQNKDCTVEANIDTPANIYRDSTYTLLAKNSIGGNPAALNLNFNLQIPPTAVITTDSLVVYKGAYVTLSGADSFDNITGYLWSNGSTSSEIVLLIDHTQNISLTVTNPYGSDTTTVTIICKDTPIIDKSPNLITVTTDALEVPISAIPYQEFYIILNNQNCYITLRQLGDYIYASLRVDNNVIFSNVICNINAPLNVYPSPYFTGILQFYDEKGTDKPHYSELGTRWKLKYRESRLPGEVY